MSFNENTRVKIPAILHLCRLGYEYISLSNSEFSDSFSVIGKSRINFVKCNYDE
jgi:type I restriction enzyme R subunit